MLFAEFGADLTLKQALNKAKVSTNRSDEEWSHPGSTLSLEYVQFDPFWPDILRLALNTRLNGLSMGPYGTPGPKDAA